MVEEPKIDSAILESFREVEMDEDVVIDSGQSPPQYTRKKLYTDTHSKYSYLYIKPISERTLSHIFRT